jgi:energy-coupling factor transport system permease protein
MHVPAESPIHRLDPRLKMGAALLLMTLPFAAPAPLSNLILVAFVTLGAHLAGVPLPALLRTLRTVFWLGFFMFFFHMFTVPGRAVLTWRGVAITVEGLLLGATQVYRLSLLVVLSSLLTFTTSPAQLTHGLETLFRPLTRLGMPVREVALVLTIALSFVPTLFDQVVKIGKAQQARGADVQAGPPWQRIRAWVPTFVPIFVAAFRRADQLATAMEARGFRGARRRTHLHQLALTRGDLTAALAVVSITAVVLLTDWLL